MNENISYIIKNIISDFEIKNLKETFRNIGIDSIDLIAIRVEIENIFGLAFLEEEWFSFSSPADIASFLEKKQLIPVFNNRNPKPIFQIKRATEINLPQMANSGLSENWLFKEIGAIHWEGLCSGLKVASSDLVDQFGDRLYATFIAISLTCNPLIDFKENQVLAFNGIIDRYGDNIYRTRITGNHNLRAALLTSFTKRGSKGNLTLQKSVPSVRENNINEIALPPSLQEYKLLRKNLVEEIMVANRKIRLSEEQVFGVVHSINPYYEINGVGLLYFAAYPTISDIGERAYMNSIRGISKPEKIYFTIARKVFYFANCDSSDKVIYRLNSFEEEENHVKIQSSLYRESDGKKMAKIFTVKEKCIDSFVRKRE